ncbi:MAG: rhodanese-like domain-containing protein, partial [Armatimonadetes bacterium]|nr:rhodanese-like domain-containing protein [Armatimonadota bacterium]
ADLIDVREQWEWDQARIPGARLIPKGQVPSRTHELNPQRTLVIHCASGQRSADVTRLLLEKGYPRVFNLAGGIIAWMNLQLPVELGPKS